MWNHQFVVLELLQVFAEHLLGFGLQPSWTLVQVVHSNSSHPFVVVHCGLWRQQVTLVDWKKTLALAQRD